MGPGFVADLGKLPGEYPERGPGVMAAHSSRRARRPYGIQLQRCSRGLRCMVAGAVHAERFLRKVLSTAMRDMFAQSETNRIKRFYQSRFKGSADNLVIAFRKLVDGIDLGIFDNVSGSKKALLIASHADRLPSQAEAGILALSYAESLENPNR